jgi:iron complex transport system substrate-binding protein
MRRRRFLTGTAAVAALLLARRSRAVTPSRRIVSLAPSITESLFALGLGERLVGITSYCKYPPEVEGIPRIGGYLTPSYEALAAARPDLVIVLPEHAELVPKLEALGVEILRLDHRSVVGILDGLRATGARCGADAASQALVSELQRGLDGIERALAGRARPRTLIVLGRQGDRSGFRSVIGGGRGGLHDDLVARAGGVNVLQDSVVAYPTLSAEGLLHLDPDAVLECAPNRGDADALRGEWDVLSVLRAVRTGRVRVFTQPCLSVPGPRLVRLVEEMARALHPAASWSLS